jgi:hypothetical protein
VSATLQRSEKVAAGSLARSEKPSTVTYVVSGQQEVPRGVMSKCPSAEGEEERARVRRRSASGRSRSSTAHLTASRARVIERRYSCDVRVQIYVLGLNCIVHHTTHYILV